MRIKQYLILPLLLLGLSFYYISCNDLLEHSASNKSNNDAADFTIKEAQAFFENNATDLQPLSFTSEKDIKTRNADGSSPVELIPDWGDVITESNSKMTLHMIPLGSLSMIEFFATVYKEDKSFGYNPLADRRLVVAKHNDGMIDMFVITIAPEIEGTDEDANEMIENFRFLGGSNFTGKVFLSTLEGLFFRAYGYTKGKNNGTLATYIRSRNSQEECKEKVLMRISIGEGAVVMSRAGSVESHSVICQHGKQVETCGICNQYSDIEITACRYCGGINGCSCQKCQICGKNIAECYCTCYKCFNYIRNCSCKNYNGGSTTTGVGNGNSGNKPAKEIFKNDEMSEEEWEEIDEMLDMMMEDCLGGNLYNALKKDLGDKKLQIEISDGLNGGFGTLDNNSTGIIIGKQMDSSQLLHEMMHAYRAYRETATTYNASTLNGEIEAHYAQQIYLNNTPGYKGSQLEERHKQNKRRRAVMDLKNVIDNKGNLREDKTTFELEEQINEIKKVFRESPTYKDYPYDENRTPESNFNNIKTLTINC